MATATEYNAEVRQMTNDQYHADRTAVGKSGLWEFWQRRRMYQARYIIGNAPEKESTDAMDIGTLADAGLLEPERLDDLYAVYPADLLASNGAASTKAAKEWCAEQEAAGKIVLKQKQFDVVQAMVESARKQFSTWLAQPSERQQSIFWTEPETGIRCKCRPDWMILPPRSKTAFVFDLKTTQSAHPRAFAKRCEEHGYWMQHAHYSEGVAALTGREVEFYFVVVESKFPYACNVQRFKPEDVAKANAARMQALHDLAGCLATGDFSEPWEQEYVDINLRPFCFER
jgi:hypothetical protein